MKPLRNPVTVVLADDHELFRAGLKNVLSVQKDPTVKILFEATNGVALLEAVKRHSPDVVITDIKMPLMNGIQACKIIRADFPSTNVIAVTVFDDLIYINEMLAAGANGYLVKSSTADEIREAIRLVSAGKSYYCSTTLSKLYGKIEMADNSSRQLKKITFTAQEISVIKLMCKELTTKQIASDLGLAKRTVEDYRHHIQEKIGAKNMVGIALYALVTEIIAITDLESLLF